MRNVNLIFIFLYAIIGLSSPSTEKVLLIHTKAQSKVSNLKVLLFNEDILRLKIIMEYLNLMKGVIPINKVMKYLKKLKVIKPRSRLMPSAHEPVKTFALTVFHDHIKVTIRDKGKRVALD